MWSASIVHQQFQADHIPIEMRGRCDIFGPETHNGKFGWHGKLLKKQNDQHKKLAGRDDEKQKPLGDDLLSQEVALQVPSALARLTAGFGMGPGVPTPLKSPRDFSLQRLDC